jgi:peptidoglycan/xylan/chitin deacetylase (PgdA/CDA1 family)
MRIVRPFFAIGRLFPGTVCRIITDRKELYLTFDDGPHPDSTKRIVEILDRYGVKCLFFCTGKHALQFPGLISLLTSHGHLLGNHGFEHPDGWKMPVEDYLEDVRKASETIDSSFFRPPYGRMRLSQFRELKKKYTIFLWDIMAYDFDRDFGSERSLKVLKRRIRPGSVIVLHDTPSSSSAEFLDEFICYSLGEGYSFALPYTDITEKIPGAD